MEFAVSWFLLDSPVKWGGPGVKSVPINTQSLGFLQFHTLTTFCWPGAPTLVSEATLRDRIRSRVPHIPRPAAASLSAAPPQVTPSQSDRFKHPSPSAAACPVGGRREKKDGKWSGSHSRETECSLVRRIPSPYHQQNWATRLSVFVCTGRLGHVSFFFF